MHYARRSPDGSLLAASRPRDGALRVAEAVLGAGAELDLSDRFVDRAATRARVQGWDWCEDVAGCGTGWVASSGCAPLHRWRDQYR
jgi:hypothetical protein